MFQGSLFVLRAGIPREHLPQELGFGSGMTCWRRPAEWRTGYEVLITDATGIPPAATLTGGNHSDVTQLRCRHMVWDLGVKPLIPRGAPSTAPVLGTQRWVVDRAFAHRHWFRCLRSRWEIPPCADGVDERQQGPAQSGELVLDP